MATTFFRNPLELEPTSPTSIDIEDVWDDLDIFTVVSSSPSFTSDEAESESGDSSDGDTGFEDDLESVLEREAEVEAMIQEVRKERKTPKREENAPEEPAASSSTIDIRLLVEERKKKLKMDSTENSREKILEQCYWDLYRDTSGFSIPPPPIIEWKQRREERGYKSRSFMKNRK